MVGKRQLPPQHNPLMMPEHTPEQAILLERRRLGQTNLFAKVGQVGITNATKPENLGNFDYAHLRVPLPKDLKGSGVFSLQRNHMYPESYFLMRRSSDGYVSATGMFKASFPWASVEEEGAERQYHHSIPSAGPDEVAGNVWIAPDDALKLADEYLVRPWIEALLSPEPIPQASREKGAIASPPPYRPAVDKSTEKLGKSKPNLPPPSATPSTRSTRSRELRSASPSKASTATSITSATSPTTAKSPAKKAAATGPSPRKQRAPRKTKAEKDREAREKAEQTEAASSALQTALENGTQSSVATESIAEQAVNGAPVLAGATEDKVHIEVDETVKRDRKTETTTTAVRVEVPAASPDLPLPEKPEEMIANARAMVEEANKMEDASGKAAGKSRKRKAEEAELKDQPEAEEEGAEGSAVKAPAAKRAKTKPTEEQRRKERLRYRAAFGVGATLAIGALIPYFI
ncbi:hypothetical protein BDY21DRAFT_370538 [Lineolata rhizophorae]|uniref:HTH APSES-type domain-containing protein n=1 Tax=Lineolata rhizophorae TaxID=578093 RepID=A0A6A6P567_9PEZI|nr:hypothetical protein BDY21DRAFT_370538 [Lineolata rhizophorae]